MKIAVIGLGKVGFPLAAVIADSGINVIGVDLDSKICGLINRGINPIPEEPGLNHLLKKHYGKKLIATTNYEEAKDCIGFIVIVPLFLDDSNNPQFASLEEAFRNIARFLKKKDIVVLETTVPPATTETLVRRWLEDGSKLRLNDFYLAYSPERIMTGFSVSRLKKFPKVIGGVNKESGRKAFELYRKFIPNLYIVSSARVAEFIKVIEGCYRDVNIALANEVFKVAEELKIDFYEARNFANHEYCHIHLPSTGVGGHCIPIYPWFLIKDMEKKGKLGYARLIRTSREVNDEMINYWGERIIRESQKLNKPLSNIKICINGITFRRGVGELHCSRNLALAKFLQDKDLDVYAHDEILSKDDVEKLGLKWIKPEDAEIIFNSFDLTITVR